MFKNFEKSIKEAVNPDMTEIVFHIALRNPENPETPKKPLKNPKQKP